MIDFTICPYCKIKSTLVGGDVIYPHRRDLYNKMFWHCGPCNAYVGTHKNSKDHAPLGRLANEELRYWKQQTHGIFDPIWKEGKMKRNEAYQWLADLLGIQKSRCHVGFFDEEQCKQAIKLVRENREKL